MRAPVASRVGVFGIDGTLLVPWTLRYKCDAGVGWPLCVDVDPPARWPGVCGARVHLLPLYLNCALTLTLPHGGQVSLKQ